MRTQDVLTACRIGAWRWDNDIRLIELDPVAAELLGLPAQAATLSEPELRARFHVGDFAESRRFLAAAAAGRGIAETELRVVAEDGTELRTVRTRVRIADPQALAMAATPAVLLGTFTELPATARPTFATRGQEEEWRRTREAFVLDLGQELSEASTTRDVLRVATTVGVPGFRPDAIAVYAREGNELRMVEYHEREATPETERAADALPMPMSVDYAFPAAEALRTGRAVYLSSPAEFQERYPEVWPAVAPFRRTAWAYLPLMVAGRAIGVLLAAFTHPVTFGFDERSLLATIARLLARALSRAFLQDTERELSADLQHTMRPAPAPDVPGMRLAARYVPTGGGLQVGGDWYDVIPLPSGRIALVIGDVQGHDVRAAAIMAQLRIALRAYASEGHHPDAVLSRASRFLAALAPMAGRAEAADDRFATCLYVEVDPPSGTLDVARAGHPDPAMLLQDGTMLTRPTAGGLPLGIDPSGDYPITRLMLEPGETLLLCTDGLLEFGHRDLDAGWARLRRAAAGLAGVNVDELADALIESVHAAGRRREGPRTLSGQDEDDIALLLLGRPDRGVAHEPALRAPVRRMVLTVAQSEPARIAEARGQLGALLHDWTDPERVYGAELMLSEIVTNVLTHTEGDAVIVAVLSGPPGSRLLRVEVTDPSDELPHRRHPGELASSGRGLMLMESLADAWGAAPRGEGKTTWFELREPEPEPEPGTGSGSA